VARPAGVRAGVVWLELNDPDAVMDWLHGWLRSSPQVPVGAAVNE